jgi:hypothetical protein
MRLIMLIPSAVWGWEDAQVIGLNLTHHLGVAVRPQPGRAGSGGDEVGETQTAGEPP